MRATAQESRAASVHALQDSLNRWLTGSTDPAIAKLWLEGIANFEALEPVDRIRF